MAIEDTQGQAAATDPKGQPDPGIQTGQVEDKPFHAWKDQSFKSPDELNAFLDKSAFMQSDYTKKTQGVAEERKRFENDRAMHLRSVSEFEEKRKGYARFEAFEKELERNPNLMRQFKSHMNRGVGGTDLEEVVGKVIESRLGPQLKDFEKSQAEQRMQQEKAQHFAAMKAKYPNFNEKAVEELNAGLMKEGATMADLVELLHFASIGKGYDPAKEEQRVLDGLKKKKDAGIAGAAGARYPGPEKNKHTDFETLTEAIKAGTA